MVSQTGFTLPANWQVNAIEWAARKAGLNYGTFTASIQGNDAKRKQIEAEYQKEQLRLYRDEQKRLKAAKLNSEKRGRS